MASVFTEIRLYYDSTLCFGVGYSIEEITMDLSLAMTFQNCYKEMLKSFCDFSNWHGESAKLVDECDTSEEQSITLYSVSPVPDEINDYWYGGSTYSSSGCV